jgi:hypothetical protein
MILQPNTIGGSPIKDLYNSLTIGSGRDGYHQSQGAKNLSMNLTLNLSDSLDKNSDAQGN